MLADRLNHSSRSRSLGEAILSKIRAHFLLLLTVISSLHALPALAGTPQQAVNKTVHTNYTFAVHAISASGKAVNASVLATHNIYVSSAGRLFDRGSYSSGSARTGGDGAPGAAINNLGEVRSLRFEGNRIVGDVAFTNGARRFIITFDPNFSNCEVSVVFGRAGGATKRKGPDGQLYTIESAELTSRSCSVQAGNGLN
jgi:hypothetical protein